MIPLDRFTVVLDACTLLPMLVRDVLLTLAGHEFFNPKWSARIRAEWMRNLSERLGERSFHSNTVTQVQRIATAMDAAFPDAAIEFECAEAAILEPVHVKDRHVVAAAMAVQADAIVTFNIADFAVAHLKEHLQIEVITPMISSWISSTFMKSAQFPHSANFAHENTSLGAHRIDSTAAKERPCANFPMVEHRGRRRPDLKPEYHRAAHRYAY
jgi:hypothetical protein